MGGLETLDSKSHAYLLAPAIPAATTRRFAGTFKTSCSSSLSLPFSHLQGPLFPRHKKSSTYSPRHSIGLL